MKRVLITGASSGIGKSIAEKYKKENYYVIGTGTKSGSFSYLDEYVKCDFIFQDQVDLLMNSVSDIDILINNAGINKISNFCDISDQDFLKLHSVNLLAPFKLCKRYVPYMIENKWGRIVNMCSIWSKISKIGRANYSSSKFALNGMSIALSHEVSQNNVLVNCVSPGFVNTELTLKNLGENLNSIIDTVPMKRLCSTKEIADFVFWLGSENNTFITGQNLTIDGGFSLA